MASISGLPPPSTYADDAVGNGNGSSNGLPPPVGTLPPLAENGSEKVYYLACLKCREWEDLQSISIETMSKLTVR